MQQSHTDAKRFPLSFHYDGRVTPAHAGVRFLVVGSGSGLDVANVAAQRGQSVVEKGHLGGPLPQSRLYSPRRCCLPRRSPRDDERADEFGIDASVNSVAFADIVREVNEEVHEDSDSIRRGLESSSDHDLYQAVQGEAAVCDYCAGAFGADEAVEDAGLVCIDENEIITF